MPGNTPLGIPYPLGSDRVSDGDNAIESLARWLDSSIAFGACYTLTPGAGMGATNWYSTHTAIGVIGGCAVVGAGITVPRKGWYSIHAFHQMTFTQQVKAYATLFVGDGSGQWAQATCQMSTTVPDPTVPQSVSLVNTALLAAGATVRWGMSATGTSAGPGGNPTSQQLLVRLICPVP